MASVTVVGQLLCAARSKTSEPAAFRDSKIPKKNSKKNTLAITGRMSSTPAS
jgi:hypothetical protein